MHKLFIIFFILLTFPSIAQDNIRKLLNKTFYISLIPKAATLDGIIDSQKTIYLYKEFFHLKHTNASLTSLDVISEYTIAKITFTSMNNENVNIKYILSTYLDDSRTQLLERLKTSSDIDLGEIDNTNNFGLNGISCADCNVSISIPLNYFNNFKKIFYTVIKSLPSDKYPSLSGVNSEIEPKYKFNYIKYIDGNNRKTFHSDPCAYYDKKCYYRTTDYILEMQQVYETTPLPRITDLQWNSGNVMMIEERALLNYLGVKSQ